MSKRKIWKEIRLAVISSLIVSAIGIGLSVYVSVKVNETKIEHINSQLEEINKNIEKLYDAQIENGKMLSAHDVIIEMLKSSYTNNQSTSAKKISFEDPSFLKAAVIYPEKALSGPLFVEGTIVARDLEKDKKYTDKELQNTLIVTYYIEDDNEVYFCGEYNENNCWHGECILNVYKNNELITVFEGVYNNGDLCNYKRVSCDEKDEWTYAERIDCDTYTEGQTWNYKKNKTFSQEITTENFDESQIISVDDFKSDIDKELISYYRGRTSDGYYNDETGDAVLITYFGKGEIDSSQNKEAVKTFYQGKIREGNYKDESDSSWYITREIDTTYMFYEGSFSGKTADHKNVKAFENFIGYDRIVEILKEKGFEEYKDDFYVNY